MIIRSQMHGDRQKADKLNNGGGKQTDYSSLHMYRYEFNALSPSQYIYLYFSSVLKLVDCAVDLQCGIVCLQDVAHYTCAIDGSILGWMVPNLMNPGNTHTLTISTFAQTENTDTFTAVLTNESDPLVSTLSFNVTDQLDNKQIACLNSGMSNGCTIMISGI